MAFIRSKKIKGKIYYYIVENQWVMGKVRQYVLMYLGTADSLLKKLKKRRAKNVK
jgi:hypothetical protein